MKGLGSYPAAGIQIGILVFMTQGLDVSSGSRGGHRGHVPPLSSQRSLGAKCRLSRVYQPGAHARRRALMRTLNPKMATTKRKQPASSATTKRKQPAFYFRLP